MARKAMEAVFEAQHSEVPSRPDSAGQGHDPPMPDWSQVELPASWVDELHLRRPRDFLMFAKRLFGKRQAVELPASLPGADRVPDYALKEFHHLPNGFFSRRFAENYAEWFDITMLGRMGRARRDIVNELAGRRSVLDLGCGGGDLAASLVAAGIPDVVGLDVSPYMLQQASQRHPGLRLVHAA